MLSYANNPGEIATKKFIMYHIQLPAFRKEYQTLESVKGDAFLTWLYALDNGYKSKEEMEALSEMTDGLRNFATQYNYAIDDPELIRRYRFYEDGRRDVATRISVATKKADRNAKIEIARNMKNKGFSAEMISDVTGIPASEIGAL